MLYKENSLFNNFRGHENYKMEFILIVNKITAVKIFDKSSLKKQRRHSELQRTTSRAR